MEDMTPAPTQKSGNVLWTKNFTVLVLGSFVSMVGYVCASFAMGLLAYDNTESVLLYAITLVASSLPRLIMPLVSGTIFDRRSRRRAIPLMDYGYTVIFLVTGLLLRFDMFPYWTYLVVGVLIGCIDGIYLIAFDSLFPLLTTKATRRRAYSINSMLYPIASIITIPLTLVGYELVGASNIFLASSVLFFLTATFETQIKVREPHLVPYQPEKQALLPAGPKELEQLSEGIPQNTEKTERKGFFDDFKEGVKYLKSEKGLLAITLYFFVISICGAFQNTLMLPYFRDNDSFPIDGMWVYLTIYGASTFGRIIGANLNARIKYPCNRRFDIAVVVYIVTNLATIVLFHLPLYWMIGIMAVEGMLAVTSYNIRIASTQNYVPDRVRGRYNGAFLFFNMLGSIIGQIVAGGVGERLSVPWLITIVFSINLVFVFIIIIPAGRHIKKIYNADL